MKATRKKKIVILFSAASVLAIIAIALWPATQESLAERLARALSRNPDRISVNIPPAPGRYPGAVLVQTPDGLWLPLVQKHESANQTSETFEIADAAASTSNASLYGKNDFVGQALSGGIDARVSVGITAGKVYEETIPELKKELLANKDVLAATKRGLDAYVVVRAYEGVPTFHVSRGRNLSSEGWAKLKDHALEAEGRLQADDSFEFKSNGPVVVGFESCKVKYIVDNFGSAPNDVKLLDFPVTRPSVDSASLKPLLGSVATNGIRSITMGCGTYEHRQLGDLPAAAASQDLVEKVLLAAGTTPLSINCPTTNLSSTQFQNAMDAIVSELKRTRPHAVIIYLVGHTISVGNGIAYFVCSDYTGDLTRDLAPFKIAARLDRPESPLSGIAGIEGILDVAQVLEAEYPEEIDGLISLSRIHRCISEADTPFALLVDGCYDDRSINQIREEFQITDSGDYHGITDSSPGAEYDYLQKYLDAFGTAVYLQSENVVVLGAKPGSLARTEPHPELSGGIGPNVGPLASHLTKFVMSRFAMGTTTNWGDLFRSIADHNRPDELRAEGAISWSDFSMFDSEPLLQGH